MSILAFATGVANVVQKESTSIGNTTSGYLADYVKEGIPFSGSTDYPITTSNSSLDFGSTSGDFWVSDTIRIPSTFSWSDRDVMYVTTSSDDRTENYCFGIKATSSENLDLVWYNGTEEEVIVSDIAGTYSISVSGVVVRFDINFNYGTDGSIDLYADRQLLISVSLDTTAMGRTPSKVRFGSAQDFDSSITVHSSVIVADEDTTLLTMVQFELDGDGSFTDFTNGYSYLSAIGETGDNYSVESSEAGDVSTYTFASRSSEISGGTVVGLGLYCRAKTQEAVSADQFRFVTYDGTDTAYSDYIEMDEFITPYQAILTTNPAGDAWTLDDIATHEFGFEVSENG